MMIDSCLSCRGVREQLIPVIVFNRLTVFSFRNEAQWLADGVMAQSARKTVRFDNLIVTSTLKSTRNTAKQVRQRSDRLSLALPLWTYLSATSF